MRSLVTGAGGFVGRHLMSYLMECGDEVLGTDLAAFRFGCKTTVLDVSSPDGVAKLLGDFRPEVIYHLAGMAFVPDAEANFESALKANVLGTSIIYRMAHILGLSCVVVFVSSAEVYGKVQPSELPVREDTPLRPANNYSLSKLMAELVTERYARSGSPRSVVMRPFNHIGPGQNLKFVTSAFASQLAKIAHGKAAPVVEVGNLEAQRDFSDVRDVVRAYRLAAEKGNGTYNLSAGKPVPIQTILDELIAISGLSVEVRQDPARMRGPEVPVLYGSYEKAHKELGWSPVISLRESLTDIYRYWFDHEK